MDKDGLSIRLYYSDETEEVVTDGIEISINYLFEQLSGYNSVTVSYNDVNEDGKSCNIYNICYK